MAGDSERADPGGWMRRAAAKEPVAPVEIDTTVAHSARVWNYWLGGKDCYQADREAGDQVFEMFPDIVQVAKADRQFLGRAVHYLAGEAGLRQFLDVGTGLPTVDNTHEVAQGIAPESRVVYVDNDPIVLAHARALLEGTPGGVTDYIEADARDTATILRAAAGTLDFTRPVAVMLLGLLNFIPDDREAYAVVRDLMAAVPPGSYLAVTHPTHDIGGGKNVEAMKFWNDNVTPKICARTRDGFSSFFGGLEMVGPGIMSCSTWRAQPTEIGPAEAEVAQFGALGRKP